MLSCASPAPFVRVGPTCHGRVGGRDMVTRMRPLLALTFILAACSGDSSPLDAMLGVKTSAVTVGSLPLGAPCHFDAECQSLACDLEGSDTCEPANTCGNGTID